MLVNASTGNSVMKVRRFFVGAMLALLAAAPVWTGCAANDAPQAVERVSETRSAVFGGTPQVHPETGFLTVSRGVSGSLQPNAVLIAPSLVVTATFSVAKGFSFGVGVNVDTSGAVCATIGGVVEPSELTFTLGDGATTPLQFIKDGNRGTSRGVKQIITNGEVDSCKAGVAFLVLDKPIDGVSLPLLELDVAPVQNDSVTACGWGPIDTKCAFPTTVQCVTGKVEIGGRDGGYYAADQDTFPPGFILTSINSCGDRGGPLYNANGNLVGILDRYFQPDKSKLPTLDRGCADCENAVSAAILLSAYGDVLARAFSAVGSSPHRAGRPAPADTGGACVDNLDCNSQLCVSIGASKACSQDCSNAPCPTSTVCTSVGKSNVCLPGVQPESACSVTVPASPREAPRLLWLSAAVAGLLAARQARRSRNSRKNGGMR